MELIYKKDALHAVLHNEGQAAVAAVQNIKAVDAVPVVHGEWQDEQRGRWIYAKCNLCGKVQDVRSNYCPNCGAKMDGKENADGCV